MAFASVETGDSNSASAAFAFSLLVLPTRSSTERSPLSMGVCAIPAPLSRTSILSLMILRRASINSGRATSSRKCCLPGVSARTLAALQNQNGGDD